MLDIKFIRENKEIVAMGAKKKHIDIDLDRLIVLDDKRKELQLSFDTKRAEQNKVSDQIGSLAPDARAAVIAQMSEVKKAMQADEAALEEVMKEWRALMVRVPNVPDMTVPDGTSDADNQEVKTWGEKPTFDFAPKSAADLLLSLDMADFERGAKVAGFEDTF